MPVARPYHHGNLKPALLAAAVELTAEVGPAAFTLREVARRAGVSHNAPYRHFRDKNELMAAVAQQGFEHLQAAMTDGVRGEADPLKRLWAAGLAYIDFALGAPEHLQVMFDWPLAMERYPELTAAGAQAFNTLLDLIGDYRRTADAPSGDVDNYKVALTAWSLVHGIAKLAISGRLGLSSPEVRDFALFSMANLRLT